MPGCLDGDGERAADQCSAELRQEPLMGASALEGLCFQARVGLGLRIPKILEAKGD